MSITTKSITRVFRHGATEYPDPAPGAKPDDVLALLASGVPSFNNACLEGPSIEGDKQVFIIKTNVGTKG